MFYLAILWAIGTAILLYNFKDIMIDLGYVAQIFLVLILMVGTPFFFAVEVLEGLLDLILPEDWDE